MSDVAKKARAAMKSKAQRLGSSRPLEKVDSSSWTPPELLNADVKTGMRPISRRQFKKGGKVMGDAAPQRADRVQRAGKKPVTPDSFVNKNVKEANEEREGIKHIGGMKKGGRAKKMDGGVMSPAMAGAAKAMARGQAIGNVPGGILASQPASSRLARSTGLGMKKGGEAKHDDVAADKALIKKMVKPSARTGKAKGGGMPLKGHNYHSKTDAELRYILKDANEAARNMKDMDSKAEGKYLDQVNDASTVLGYRKRGGQPVMPPAKGEDSFMNKGGRAKRATGGGIFSGASYPGKVPGAVPGGRTARATGGKTKGKTAINIVINAGKPAGQDGMVPPPGPMGAPKGLPIPVPPPGAGMPPGAAPPMPMPPPGVMGAGGPPMPPPGAPPMGRKRGGRTYSSYKDMDAGAGSGKGRLEKTEIQANK